MCTGLFEDVSECMLGANISEGASYFHKSPTSRKFIGGTVVTWGPT